MIDFGVRVIGVIEMRVIGEGVNELEVMKGSL